RWDGMEPRDAGRSRWGWYAASFACFVAAMLSKTVACSLPVALAIMRLQQRRRIDLRFVISIVPMLAVGFLLALHTANLERENVGAAGPDFAFTAAQRLVIAARALAFYPLKLLIPWPLIFVYPRWNIERLDAAALWPMLGVAAAAGAALIACRREWRG